jgi:hypothetical protein
MCDNSKHYFDMKIRDLSIGDWVFIKGEPARALRLTQVGYSVFKGLSGQMYRGIGGNISPLPIAPEILEKNGFEIESDGAYIISQGWKQNDFYGNYIEIKNGKQTINGCEYELWEMKYVHQLQHAMKLAGIDKEIEL